MLSDTANIAVNMEACIEHNCLINCDLTDCKLCTSCIDDGSLENLHRAYREHIRRGGFERIFPTSGHFDQSFIEHVLTSENQIAANWFSAKCQADAGWC